MFRRAREILTDDYGLEPSAALRDLERVIPTGGDLVEPGVRQPVVIRDDSAALAVPAQLPMDVCGYTATLTLTLTLV